MATSVIKNVYLTNPSTGINDMTARKYGNIVTISFLRVMTNMPSQYTIGTLPSGIRPPSNVYISCFGISGSSVVSRFRIQIAADGVVTYSGDAYNPGQEVSFTATYIVE